MKQESGDEKDRLVAATATAFELLEIACHGRRGLNEADTYAAGLAEFVESRTIDAEFRSAVASLPEGEWKYDEHGKKLPVPFEEGLAFLIPKPGVRKSQTADEREVRFRGWLSHFYSKQEPDTQKRLVLVGEMIEEMKQKDIPPGLFSKALLFYPDWWDAHQRERKSAAGKKGQEIKQAKQAASEPKQARKRQK
jgi:hypothetical protein